MATVNYEDLAESRFAEDLKAIAKPAISATDLAKAYKFYGTKGGVQGKNDTQLYKKATTDILAWWKRVKGQGYYQTTKAGKPLGSGSSKPPTAKAATFGAQYMRETRKQYGISAQPPQWAVRNPQRFQRWLASQLRRRGMTL